MSYKQIIEEKDTREALNFLLERTHTVQQHKIIEMLIDKYENSLGKVFLLIEIPNYLESEERVIGAYIDLDTAKKDMYALTKEFKDENGYRIEMHNILKD